MKSWYWKIRTEIWTINFTTSTPCQAISAFQTRLRQPDHNWNMVFILAIQCSKQNPTSLCSHSSACLCGHQNVNRTWERWSAAKGDTTPLRQSLTIGLLQVVVGMSRQLYGSHSKGYNRPGRSNSGLLLAAAVIGQTWRAQRWLQRRGEKKGEGSDSTTEGSKRFEWEERGGLGWGQITSALFRAQRAAKLFLCCIFLSEAKCCCTTDTMLWGHLDPQLCPR